MSMLNVKLNDPKVKKDLKTLDVIAKTGKLYLLYPELWDSP